MADEISISARINHLASKRINQVNRVFLDQTGIGKVGGEPISTTSLATLDFSALTTPGMGWMLNLGTNDISVGPFISSTFYPMWIGKPGIPTLMYFDPTTKSTNVIKHKTASGTSLFEWEVREL